MEKHWGAKSSRSVFKIYCFIRKVSRRVELHVHVQQCTCTIHVDGVHTTCTFMYKVKYLVNKPIPVQTKASGLRQFKALFTRPKKNIDSLRRILRAGIVYLIIPRLTAFASFHTTQCNNSTNVPRDECTDIAGYH